MCPLAALVCSLPCTARIVSLKKGECALVLIKTEVGYHAKDDLENAHCFPVVHRKWRRISSFIDSACVETVVLSHARFKTTEK